MSLVNHPDGSSQHLPDFSADTGSSGLLHMHGRSCSAPTYGSSLAARICTKNTANRATRYSSCPSASVSGTGSRSGATLALCFCWTRCALSAISLYLPAARLHVGRQPQAVYGSALPSTL